VPEVPAPPPIEWVPGPRFWWVYRYVAFLGVIALGPVAVALIAQGFNLGSPLAGWLSVVWGIVLAAGALLASAYLRTVPSTRRIGLSPWGLTIDNGWSRTVFGWSELSLVERAQVHRYGWGATAGETRTRIRVGSGVPRMNLLLTAQQGDRLAHFLEIP